MVAVKVEPTSQPVMFESVEMFHFAGSTRECCCCRCWCEKGAKETKFKYHHLGKSLKGSPSLSLSLTLSREAPKGRALIHLSSQVRAFSQHTNLTLSWPMWVGEKRATCEIHTGKLRVDLSWWEQVRSLDSRRKMNNDGAPGAVWSAALHAQWSTLNAQVELEQVSFAPGAATSRCRCCCSCCRQLNSLEMAVVVVSTAQTTHKERQSFLLLVITRRPHSLFLSC